MNPPPIYITVAGQQLRVRHDDPRLVPYSPGVQRLRSAAGIASGLEGLRLLLETAMGDHYQVEVIEGEVRLRRS